MPRSSQLTYIMDVDAAIIAIKQYNASSTLLTADSLLRQHFPTISASLDHSTMAERVVLLDALWATRLFMESGSTERIIGSLITHAAEIERVLLALPSNALENDPHLVVAAAQRLLPVILHLTADDGSKPRQNYSFATKFFHWVTRHHFPIVDSKARKCISEIQAYHNASNRVRKYPPYTDLSYLEEYPRWILFYSDLIAGLTLDVKERLLTADGESQPTSRRAQNSLLRILDKVFYIQGGGTGLGQMTDS